ncbi:hypothetical protein AN958_07521 [Leucoagaricus sp. SymC.cos]|nr:hypothetical protein AN958_07521 [Leucoagaricus sp. SymC.cos]
MSDTKPQPVLEILSYLASDALLKDESLTHHAYEQIRNWKGLQHIYEGTSLNEPKRRYLIIVWDTYEDHKSLMDDPVVYPQVLEKLGKCLGGEVEMRHASFTDNTIIALTSPVTEIVHLKLKEGSNKTDFEKHMADFCRHALTAPIAKEHAPFVIGEQRESPGEYFFLGGWTTKQVRVCFQAPVLVNPESTKIQVDGISQYATYKLHHLVVREYGLRRD